jgi:hypothetical protein
MSKSIVFKDIFNFGTSLDTNIIFEGPNNINKAVNKNAKAFSSPDSRKSLSFNISLLVLLLDLGYIEL